MRTCPHCGADLAPIGRKKPIQVVPVVDLSSLSKAELFAHYKRTAPLEDARFWLRHAKLSPQVRAGFEALIATAETITVSRPAFYRELIALQDQWRHDSNRREALKKAELQAYRTRVKFRVLQNVNNSQDVRKASRYRAA